ncbi:hypothetical protein [Massilia sp. SYSU DXS3249]
MTARKGQCFADAGRKRHAGDPPFLFSQRPPLSRRHPGLPHPARRFPLFLSVPVRAGCRQFDSNDCEIRRRFPCLERYAVRRGRALSGLIFKPEMWERGIGIAWAGAMSNVSPPLAIRMPRSGLWL